MTASKLARRRLLGRAGWLGLAALPWPVFAAASRDPLIFTAYRNGSRLGFHRIDFVEDEGRLSVDIEIAFDVKLAFIPLYRYRHRNREIWEGSQLVSMSTETDDNGTAFKVDVTRSSNRLLVQGADGRLELPGETLTTSYWNEAAMASGEWLDTQAGRLVRSEVTKKPAEVVQVEDSKVEATPYDLAGDITCTLWYADRRWVKLRFVGEDGSVIDYTLETSQQNG
ncbi:MAG: DUF6134 family protein [Geminicoccaceae bacterium]